MVSFCKIYIVLSQIIQLFIVEFSKITGCLQLWQLKKFGAYLKLSFVVGKYYTAFKGHVGLMAIEPE